MINEKLQEEMSINGIKFMKDYSLEKGFEVFGKFVSDYLNDELDSGKIKGKMYTKDLQASAIKVYFKIAECS